MIYVHCYIIIIRIYVLVGYQNGKENSKKKDVANTKVHTAQYINFVLYRCVMILYNLRTKNLSFM